MISTHYRHFCWLSFKKYISVCAINMFKDLDTYSCEYLNHFKTNVKGAVNFIQ